MFFSDAVFAIAMTLLVLDLKLPELTAPVTADAWQHALLEKVPSWGALCISFVVIASLWVTHHHRFNTIARVDNRLIQLDLVLLFFVALMPVPTSMLLAPTGDSPWAVMLYAAVVGGAFAVINLLCAHAFRAGLTTATREQYLHGQIATTPVWAVFLASIPLALVAPRWAMLAWILIAPIQQVLTRVRRHRHA